jgi:hypothetical protein
MTERLKIIEDQEIEAIEAIDGGLEFELAACNQELLNNVGRPGVLVKGVSIPSGACPRCEAPNHVHRVACRRRHRKAAPRKSQGRDMTRRYNTKGQSIRYMRAPISCA